MEEIRYEAYEIAWKILGDEKRLEKLRKIADSNALFYSSMGQGEGWS